MVHQLNKRLLVFENKEQLSMAAAWYILFASKQTDKRFSIALSGGSTPQRLYQILAAPPFAGQVNWKNLNLFIVDERYVPATHPDSNFKMIWEKLLSKIKIPGKNIFQINTTGTPETDALAYEKKIKTVLKNKGFDLMLLGIGTDGHTASLFPGSAVLRQSTRLVQSVYEASKNQYRITCTLPMINRSGQVIFLVSGEDKTAAFQKINAKQKTLLPAALVNTKKPVWWMVSNDVIGKG
jgi:6-phosphogluconolactonase